MKTTIITSLALIATALAAPALNERQVDKRNVKLGLNKEFLGSPPNEQVNPEVTISQCCK
jgi:hypothetical protein